MKHLLAVLCIMTVFAVPAWAEPCPATEQLQPGEVCYQVIGFVKGEPDFNVGPTGTVAGGYYIHMDREVLDGLCTNTRTWQSKGNGLVPWGTAGEEFNGSTHATISAETLAGHYPILLRFRGQPEDACASNGRHVVRYAIAFPPPCWKALYGWIPHVDEQGTMSKWACALNKDWDDMEDWEAFVLDVLGQE